jgi:hypothetical protein
MADLFFEVLMKAPKMHGGVNISRNSGSVKMNPILFDFATVENGLFLH